MGSWAHVKNDGIITLIYGHGHDGGWVKEFNVVGILLPAYGDYLRLIFALAYTM